MSSVSLLWSRGLQCQQTTAWCFWKIRVTASKQHSLGRSGKGLRTISGDSQRFTKTETRNNWSSTSSITKKEARTFCFARLKVQDDCPFRTHGSPSSNKWFLLAKMRLLCTCDTNRAMKETSGWHFTCSGLVMGPWSCKTCSRKSNKGKT